MLRSQDELSNGLFQSLFDLIQQNNYQCSYQWKVINITLWSSHGLDPDNGWANIFYREPHWKLCCCQGLHKLQYILPETGRIYYILLPGAAYSILHNSHFRLSKNAVSNETCWIKSWEFYSHRQNYFNIDSYLCTSGCPATHMWPAVCPSLI